MTESEHARSVIAVIEKSHRQGRNIRPKYSSVIGDASETRPCSPSVTIGGGPGVNNHSAIAPEIETQRVE